MLKNTHLKATLSRMRILELFENSDDKHLSAEDVYKMLSENGTDIGMATVYRVLHQLVQAGLLTRHNFENSKTMFELNRGDHHDHLMCLQCGHVEEFYDKEIEKRQIAVTDARGFRAHSYSLCIFADCLKKDCPHKKQWQ